MIIHINKVLLYIVDDYLLFDVGVSFYFVLLLQKLYLGFTI